MIPEGVAPRKPISGAHSQTAPYPTRAATAKPAMSGALGGRLARRRAARRQLIATNRPPKTSTVEKIAPCRLRASQEPVRLAELREPVLFYCNAQGRFDRDDRKTS